MKNCILINAVYFLNNKYNVMTFYMLDNFIFVAHSSLVIFLASFTVKYSIQNIFPLYFHIKILKKFVKYSIYTFYL